MMSDITSINPAYYYQSLEQANVIPRCQKQSNWWRSYRSALKTNARSWEATPHDY